MRLCVFVCAVFMCVSVWAWPSGKLSSSVLLLPLPVLPSLSGSSELRLCCPAPAFKYLTPSLCFSLSSHPPSLSLSLFRSNTSSTRAVCAVRDGLPPLSHPALLSSLFLASLSLCLFPESFPPPSLLSFSLPLTNPLCYSTVHSCIPLLRPCLSYLYESVSFFIPNQLTDIFLSISSLSFVFLPVHQIVSSSPTHYHTSFLPPSSALFTSLFFLVSLCCSTT